MGAWGCGCAMLAGLLALITAVPLLGWGNWIATVPVALLAILFSLVGISRREQGGAATLGLIFGVLILFWALFRLGLGGGIL